MSTSLRKAERSLAASAGILVFGMIYEHFSHGVYSAAMVYAFLIPFTGCVLPYALAARRELLSGLQDAGNIETEAPKLERRRVAAENFWNSGIAALTVGCIFQGVLEIYGTTNRLIIVYWIAGAVFSALGLFLFRTCHTASRARRG